MRIKKLELVGFKSFKDRTVIQFDAGITGIVGPNGCGKSNIIDALTWVMGEQSAKHLRGASMEDVIFGGAEGYAPGGMAEVSLTLENDGGPFPAKYMNYSEVQVTRRLHRSGESEYLINKEPGRLRDIQEIFMDTGAGSKGFSIVEQGAIGKIITAKPDDRRVMIEEAAGITKFKVRKRESQKKLEVTDQNLIRLNDIVGELKRQLDSLQRQAKRAERYRELKKRLEDLDLWLATLSYKDLRLKADDSQNIFTDAQNEEIAGRSELQLFESQHQKSQIKLLESEKAVEELQSRFFESKENVQKRETDLQNLKFEVEQAKRNAQMQGTLRSEVELRKSVLERQYQEVDEKLNEGRKLAEELQTAFEEAQAVTTETEERIRESDDELIAKRRDLVATTQGETQAKVQIEGIDNRIEEVGERFEKAQAVQNELLQKRVEYEERRERLKEEAESANQARDLSVQEVTRIDERRRELNGAIAEKQLDVEEFKDKLNEVTSRLYGLENLQASFEGFEEGVKNIILWSKKKQNQLHADGTVSTSDVTEFRPLSEVVEVPPQFELAMEAALGARLQVLLSPNVDETLKAVDYLKESKSGRSSFLLSQVGSNVSPEARVSPSGEGILGVMSELVTVSEDLKDRLSQILGTVVVVDRLNTALSLRGHFPEWTFVTTDGDCITSDGVMTGGSSEQADSGLLKRRREIKELSLQKEEWSGKLALAQLALTKLQEEIAKIQQQLEASQKAKSELEFTSFEKKKDLERAENEYQNLLLAVTRQEKEVLQIQDQLSQLNVKRSDLEQRQSELEARRSELEQETESLSVELNIARDQVNEARAKSTDLQVQSATKRQEVEGLTQQYNLLSRQLNEIRDQMNRMEQEQSQNSEVLSTSQVLLEEGRVDLDRWITQTQHLGEELSKVKNEYEVVSAEARELERKAGELRKKQNELQTLMNESQLKAEQARMKEQYLVDQIRERYMIHLADVLEKYASFEAEEESAKVELEDLRDKVKKIGEVNLSAIEEYEGTVKRYEFLSQQQTDLVEAKENLRKVIDRINRICHKRFKETFEAVNDRFKKVFPVLFGGGEAHLTLIEDQEKGEMGIDIIARPPGKKLQSVTLMSGGEKALTAVALIFAIFLVKPSPFCLLDEVDAPLDDANVARFNDLVREMAKRSQIIVITHNKATMEINERLYGVTMQERGVSKMVSVDLKSAQQVAGR